MKLYRLIPDSLDTLCYNGYLSDISEDLFYDLGYISYNDHYYDYVRIDYYNTHSSQYKDCGRGIFFFLSPYDALECVKNINRECYGCEIAQIMEYEVSDEDFNKFSKGICSIGGTGDIYYRNENNFEEVLIPYDYFIENDNGNVSIPLDQLRVLVLKEIYGSCGYLVDSVRNNDYSMYSEKARKMIGNSTALELFEKYMHHSNFQKRMDRRINNLGSYHKTDIITNKKVIVTLRECYALRDAVNNRMDDTPILDNLISRSNGIFTNDGLMEYIYGDKFGKVLKRK